MTKEPLTTTTMMQLQQGFDFKAFAKKYMIIAILIAFIAILAVMTEGHSIQAINLINIVRQVSAIGIIAVGMTFVIITLGIDLSVGSILALAAVVSASLAQNAAPGVKFAGLDLPVIVAVIAGLGVGAMAGLTNGILIAKFRLAPFIATLGMMSIARGLAYIYSDGRPVSNLKDGYNWIGQGYLIGGGEGNFLGSAGNLLGLPVPVALFLLVSGAAWFVLSYTKFGRYLYAIGGHSYSTYDNFDLHNHWCVGRPSWRAAFFSHRFCYSGAWYRNRAGRDYRDHHRWHELQGRYRNHLGHHDRRSVDWNHQQRSDTDEC